MADQFPEATKMVPFPAAQAVLDAVLDETAPLSEQHQTRADAAAALRAAADQVVPAEDEDVYLVPWNLTEHMRQRQDTRRKILAIADELKNTPQPTSDHH